MSLTRQYAKTCDLADFADPKVAKLIPQIAPDESADRPHRKAWEFAMAGLFLEDVGRLKSDAEVLDIAAGSEPIIFWLANRAARVVATDIYGRGAFGDREAVDTFLKDPSSFAPYKYPKKVLEVLDMDARDLKFEDESFDVIVSFSSIEHFGYPEEIAKASKEIARVLRPGGHAFIVTEVFVSLSPTDRLIRRLVRIAETLTRPIPALRRHVPSTGDLFSQKEIEKQIIRASGLKLMQPLEVAQPDPDVNIHRVTGIDQVESSTGEKYPHTLLAWRGSLFTSVCLPLEKSYA